MTDAAKRIADQALEYVFNPPVASDRVIDYATPDELIVGVCNHGWSGDRC